MQQNFSPLFHTKILLHFFKIQLTSNMSPELWDEVTYGWLRSLPLKILFVSKYHGPGSWFFIDFMAPNCFFLVSVQFSGMTQEKKDKTNRQPLWQDKFTQIRLHVYPQNKQPLFHLLFFLIWKFIFTYSHIHMHDGLSTFQHIHILICYSDPEKKTFLVSKIGIKMKLLLDHMSMD